MNACLPILNNSGSMGVNEFTTGFNFQGGGVFQPTIFGDFSFTLDPHLAALGDGHALQFTALDFGGVYQDRFIFQLAQDHLINCSGAVPGAFGDGCGGMYLAQDPVLSNPKGYSVEITQLTDFEYGVVIRFVSTIQGVDASYDGNQANFRLEGILSPYVVPVPAAVWLFGSGVLGLVRFARRRKI